MWHADEVVRFRVCVCECVWRELDVWAYDEAVRDPDDEHVLAVVVDPGVELAEEAVDCCVLRGDILCCDVPGLEGVDDDVRGQIHVFDLFVDRFNCSVVFKRTRRMCSCAMTPMPMDASELVGIFEPMMSAVDLDYESYRRNISVRRIDSMDGTTRYEMIVEKTLSCTDHPWLCDPDTEPPVLDRCISLYHDVEADGSHVVEMEDEGTGRSCFAHVRCINHSNDTMAVKFQVVLSESEHREMQGHVF